MVNQKTDFIVQAALLDKYVHMEDLSSDRIGISVVIKKIKTNPDLLRYFLGQNPSPAWASLFYENGFFNDPPNVINVDNGFQTRYWGLSAYLNSVAENAPEVVEKVISEIETDNPVIHEHLLNAISKLHPSRSIIFQSKITLWLKSEYIYFWGLAEAAINLVLVWTEAGYIVPAFEMLSIILEPVSSDNNRSSRRVGRPRVELDFVKPNLWKETIPRLGELAYFETLNLLENKLLDCIKVEILTTQREIDFSAGMSHLWRTTIADHEQNPEPDYKDNVLVAFRNHLDKGAKENITSVRQELVRYIEGNNIILKRVAIHIIATNAQSFVDLAGKLLENNTIYSDLAFHNDYFQLLSLSYLHLNQNKREKVLDMIRNGPPPERLDKARKFALESSFEVEKYLTDRKNYWIRDRLWSIKQYLNEEDKSLLKSLCETYGEPDHPAFLSWSSGGFWVKDVSPQPMEDLLTLSSFELLEYVETWKPNPNEDFGPERVSLRGLGETVATILLDFPERYAEFYTNIHKVSPEVISCLFSLAEKRLNENQRIPWDKLIRTINICAEASQKLFEKNVALDFNVRLEGIRLLQSGLTSGDNKIASIPGFLFEDVKEIIQKYLYDSHPNFAQDRPPENEIGHRDPLTTSLNSVRPIAFVCFMEFIKHTDVNNDWGVSNKSWAREHLDTKLNKDIDSSLAIHSIFGRYYWLLSKWDNVWLENVVSKIFPLHPNSNNVDYFLAAWESFVIFNRPGNKTVNSLYKEYSYSIDLLSRGKTSNTHLDIPGKIFIHLFLDYLWKPYVLYEKDRLLNIFMNRCNDEIRGHAIHTLVELMRNSPKDDIVEIWPKVREFWFWRVNEFSLSQYPSEMEKEMERFSLLAQYIPLSEKIDDIQALINPLYYGLKDGFVWHNLEKFLSLRVDSEPVQVAKIYRMMHEEITDTKSAGLKFVHYAEEADKIINTAINNNESRRDVMKTIDLIFRNNNDRYRRLYEEYS